MRLLDEVRATAQAVAQSARYVRVQTDAIEAYAAAICTGVTAMPWPID